jgi:hypothetical protein
MFRKTLSIPLWLLSGIAKLLGRVLGIIFAVGSGTFRLIINRLFGVFFGALIGFFFGKGHIGFRLFRKRKHVR